MHHVRAVVRQIHFLGAGVLDSEDGLLLRLCGLEQIPRDVIKDVPAPPGLGRLKKVEIDPVDPLAKDGNLSNLSSGVALTSEAYHRTARVSIAARRRPS